MKQLCLALARKQSFQLNSQHAITGAEAEGAETAQREPQQDPAPMRGKSPLQIFRDEWLRRRRAEGIHEAWQASMWAHISRDYAQLDAGRKQ